jgi:hypothetical protein
MRTNRELLEGLFWIRDKRGQKVRFKLNPAQELYWKKRTRRNLILKARQKGISKVIDADQLVDCFKKSTNAVVISHEKEATKRLFASVRYFIDSMEVKPALSIDSKSEMKFPKRGSSYFIGTAGQRAFGRGDTIDRAHLSEAAFYIDFEKIFNGISEAAEYGQIDIETTPNGREKFYDMWQDARDGRSVYTPIFIPWFVDREYSSDSMTEAERNGLSGAVQEMFSLPNKEWKKWTTREEKNLITRVRAEYKFWLTPGQIKWRRYKIWDKGVFFFQEYPEDDVSCFLQSGRAVFTIIETDKTKRIPLDRFDSWGSPEDREAIKNRVLYGAIDGAEGTPDGDRHVLAILDAPAGRPKAHVIWEYASNEPIDIFWAKIKPVLKSFKVHLGIEKNGVGVAHVQKAKSLGIPCVEWETTGANRPAMIVDLEEAYRKGDLIETYPEAENEARDMIYTESNRPEHRPGKHDDRVFARSIAWQMRNAPRAKVTFLDGASRGRKAKDIFDDDDD